MSKKSIPNGDQDFSQMAFGFATNLAKDPARYFVAQEEADELSAAVAAFRQALQEARFGGRSTMTTRRKDDARDAVEVIIRRLRPIISANPKVDSVAKLELGLKERTARLKQLLCPQEPPRLKFVRALHEGSGATPMHELTFAALEFGKSKPAGAVRLELFVDLVPPEEPIPAHPGANLSSRPWYLRSYTRSPIKLVPPIAGVPMRVVYWGRWADSTGNVGPFSAVAAGWIEGGSHRLLPGGLGMDPFGVGMDPNKKPKQLIDDAAPPGPENREPKYSVAVLDAQFASLHPQQVEPRRLEGPPEDREASEAA